MPRLHAKHRSGALAVAGVLLALTVLSCAKPAFRDVIGAGDDVRVTIDDPDAVDVWAVRTTSDADVAVVQLSGDQVDVGALRIRVLLPGGVVVALLSPPRGNQFSIALSGRPAIWTVEFRLGERESAPVRYRMQVVRPSSPGAGALSACADALRARGIGAWAVSVSGPPGPAGLPFPGLGAIALETTPIGALTAAPPAAGAGPTLHLRGGATLRGELARLGCAPGQVQLNLWDTGKGKPPTMSVSDASGRRLCGGVGQPACLSDPSPGRWVSWTLATSTAVGGFSLEGDELYLSSVVIQ